MTVQAAYSRPVNKRHITLTQPDGAEIEVIIDGDEFLSTLTDLAGHSIIKNKDGYYCYAFYNIDGSMYSTGYVVGKEAPGNILAGSKNIPYTAMRLNSAKKRMQISKEHGKRPGILSRIKSDTKAGPVSKNCIILPVQFSDKKFKNTGKELQNLISQRGYSANGGTGCVMDYFNAQLGGEYIFNFTLSDIITLDRKCGYYFSDNGTDKDINAHIAVKEACVKAHAAGVDFSRFDDDGDGEVDNVFLIVAGSDQADGGGDECVWSHQFFLELTGSSGLVLDNKKINSYAITTELRRNADNTFGMTGIGVFCHEYSHTLGLMDLYDTDDYASGGRADGLWYTTALMDGGSSNNETNTPPNYNAVDYDHLGLGKPEQLLPGSYSLEPISINRRYLKMETGNSGEYYLIECRSNGGWDRFTGGKGLLIYHIDKSRNNAGHSDTYGTDFTALERWSHNEVNCRPSFQCAELISSTPGISAYTSDGYLANNTGKVFYPSAANNAYSSKSTPAFIFRDGTESSIAITEIRFNGDRVDFDVVKMGNVAIPDAMISHSEIFQDAAIISWRSGDPTYSGRSFISWGKSDETLTVTEVSPYENGKYSMTLEGLSPRTAYRTKVFFKEFGVSGTSATLNFTTKSLYDGFPYIFLNYVNRNEDGSFPAGAMLPLRIYNLRNASGVQWYMDDKEIAPSGNGYYEVRTSGVLKAVITYNDGSKDIICKSIRVK